MAARVIAAGSRLVLMMGLTVVTVLGWLPLVRCLLDGPSYEWGTTLFGHQFSGAGLAGDFGYLLAFTGVALVLLYLGWRRPGAPFKIASVLWTGAMLANALHMLMADPAATFEGATLGVSVSMGLISAVVYGALFALALVWAWLGRAGEPPRWGLANTVILVVALLMLPLQYLLLSSGQGRETSDVIGVLMTMGQWGLLSLSLAPLTRARRR